MSQFCSSPHSVRIVELRHGSLLFPSHLINGCQFCILLFPRTSACSSDRISTSPPTPLIQPSTVLLLFWSVQGFSSFFLLFASPRHPDRKSVSSRFQYLFLSPLPYFFDFCSLFLPPLELGRTAAPPPLVTKIPTFLSLPDNPQQPHF